MIVKGVIGGDKFVGEIIDELPNGNVHINVFTTENGEWDRDLKRGYPVLISVKKDKVTTA